MKKIYFQNAFFISTKIQYIFIFVCVMVGATSFGQSPRQFESGPDTFTVPAGVTCITVKAWGAGGGGGMSGVDGGGGGGGGGFTSSNIAVTPNTTYTVVVGAGGTQGINGGNSTFMLGASSLVTAQGGSAGNLSTGGNGGGNGSRGQDAVGNSGGNGGTAEGTGGGTGGAGSGSASTPGAPGGSPGGGGGGGQKNSSNAGTGGGGRIIVSWIAAPTASATLQPTCTVSTGTITITAPTGTGITYSINGSTYTNTDGIFANVASGDYSITAKSPDGCVSVSTNVIINTQPATPTLTAISAPAAICSGGSLNPMAPTVTANGSTVTASGWQLETAVGSAAFANQTMAYTVAFADNGKRIRFYATNGCGTTYSNLVTLTVNNVPTIATIAAPAALCSGGSLNPMAPTVTANGSTVTASGWQLETTVGSGTFSNQTMAYTVAFADNGKKIRFYAINGCGTTFSNEVVLTVNNVPTIAPISVPAALCSGGSLNPTAPSVTANGSALTDSGWQLETAVGSGTFSNQTMAYTVAFADNGKKIRFYAINGCGTTFSNEVVLTVNNVPTIATIAAPAALCSGGSLNPTAPSVTANGSALTDSGWQLETAVGSGTFANQTMAYTVAFADNGKKIRFYAINGCGTTFSNEVVLTVNNVPTIAPIAAPAALCSGGSLNPTAPTVTANGSALTDSGWQLETAVGSGTFANQTMVYTVAFADNGKKIRFYAINGCGTTFSNEVVLTVNNVPTIAPISAPAALCSGGSLNPTAPSVTANSSALTDSGWQLETAVGSGTFANQTMAYTVAFADNGKKIRYYANNGCGTTYSNQVTLSVNPLPTTPTVGTITHPNCVTDKGSVVLSNLPSGNWTVNAENYTFTPTTATTTATISGLVAGKYKFTVTNANGCISAETVEIEIIAPRTNTWSNSGWSLGIPTSLDDKIVFADDYSLNEDIFGCSCTVSGSKNVIIKTGRTMKIVNFVKIKDNGGVNGKGTLTFENNASLVQINDLAINEGVITYQRITPEILKTDYVYWSSPVTGAKLGAIQTGTLYYSFNAAGNSWVRGSAATGMTKGTGYIVRGEGTGFNSGEIIKTANFIGAPTNGAVPVTIIGGGKNNLIGNPYPSAVDGDAFIRANSQVIDGTLYFWTHKSEIQLATDITNGTAGSGKYAYTSDDYSPFNLVGGTNYVIGNIAAGQGFFARGSVDGGTAVFNNRMRLGNEEETLDNSGFLKPASGSKTGKIPTIKKIEKNRIWLNLSNTEGAFKQMLLGYVTDATNDYDRGYDALSFNGNSFVNFYSINNNSRLTIQGRALPIQETDVVPLGYSSTIVGDFSISIDKTDGVLSTMAVFLEDKLTNITHNLKNGAYTFATEKGTFNDRFALSYLDKVTLATTDFERNENGVMISNKNKIIKIQSEVELIDKVMVFDVSGKLILEKKKVDTLELILSGINESEQLLIVKVFLQNGETISKKIIN